MQRSTSLHLLLAVACVCLFSTVQAQTYFYVDEIAVTPADPTEQDNVQLQLIGNLSSTGSSVATATAQVNGFSVELTLVTQNTIGLDVLVPHTETIAVGTLAAGTYTVTVAGSGVDDLAPPGQHSFTVSGGNPPSCDSLIIASVSWSPFSDTAVLVHVFNPSLAAFDYPGFLLLDANGDTLARETVNFFSIGPDYWHTLTVHPGAVIPAGPFNGTMQLWTDLFSAMACNWELDLDLCPGDSCQTVLVDIGNFGGGLATGSFQYTVRENGSPVAQGSFTLTADQQYDQDTLCLPPGHYLMELVPQQEPTGGQLWFGISLNNEVAGPYAPVLWSTLDALDFNLYEQCIGTPQVITEIPTVGITVERSEDAVTLARTDGKALGDLMVFDAQGRAIATAEVRTDRFGFVTASWPSGLCIMRAIGADREVLTARWVVE